MEYKNEEEFLKAYDASIYDQLSVTTDILLFSVSDEEQSNYRKTSKKHMSILLVKREDYPYKDKWCIPGGFLGIDEELEDCPRRILKRETNLSNIYLEQLYSFGQVDRDPRTRVISVSYMALVDKNRLNQELLKNASWFNISYKESKSSVEILLNNEEVKLKLKLKKENNKISVIENNDLSFDNPLVIWKGIERLKNKVNYTDIVFNMMPDYFTLGELQQVYEVILNKKLLDPAFRRIISNKVIKTNKMRTGSGHRPSYLFKYKGSSNE